MVDVNLSIPYNVQCMKDETLLKIAHIIKYARDKKGLTQEQLAEMVDLSKNSIASIESGHVNLKILNYYNICKALDIDMGVLNNFQL